MRRRGPDADAASQDVARRTMTKSRGWSVEWRLGRFRVRLEP